MSLPKIKKKIHRRALQERREEFSLLRDPVELYSVCAGSQSFKGKTSGAVLGAEAFVGLHRAWFLLKTKKKNIYIYISRA